MGLVNLDQFDHNNKMNTLSVITLKGARCILLVTVVSTFFQYSLINGPLKVFSNPPILNHSPGFLTWPMYS
jgi:hypothetical protein